MAKLEMVEGIGQVYADKLRVAGVATTEMLLEMGSTKKGREDLAEKSGISSKLILEWVNHADLFRISGVGEENSTMGRLWNQPNPDTDRTTVRFTGPALSDSHG